jgi:alpha-galactosidase/6-phospho-beta-glucosidase family protein
MVRLKELYRDLYKVTGRKFHFGEELTETQRILKEAKEIKDKLEVKKKEEIKKSKKRKDMLKKAGLAFLVGGTAAHLYATRSQSGRELGKDLGYKYSIQAQEEKDKQAETKKSRESKGSSSSWTTNDTLRTLDLIRMI